MIESLSKKTIKFYQISLVLIMCVTLGTILYFWKLGFIDGSRGKELHQASFILETYESKNILKEIRNLILDENPKLAIQKTKEIEKDFELVNRQVEVKEFEDLKKSIQRSKTSAANMISFSKVSKVVSVFNSKMNKFYDYVKKNKWRTLTRMSDRVFSLTSGHVNRAKIGNLVKQLEREFNMMTKITENSILTSSEKSEILSRINNLKTEVSMLKKYAEEKAFYFQLHKETKKSVKRWIDSVAPELTLQKMKVEQIGKYYVMGLLGILSLVALIFFSSFLVNRFYLGRSQRDLEDFFKELVTDAFQHGRPVDLNQFSDSFSEYVASLSSYFKKRMSFGAIFQDALPLSSVLLDKNLKVLWSNKNFSRDWNISEEDMAKDYMSWDYLNKLTNIGSEDPVLEALKHNVAGIYQIQVKPTEAENARPYEMFVAPVKFQNELQIMLFFYDLTNLEHTIQDQAKSLIMPIRKSLTQTVNKEFFQDEKLETEFNIVNASDIYEEFSNLNIHFQDIEEELTEQINFLNSHIEERDQFKNELAEKTEEDFHRTKGSIQALRVFKDNVIELSQIAHQLDKAMDKSKEVLFANINTISASSKKINELKASTVEMCESMGKLNDLKDSVKSARQTYDENKSRFSHDLSQLSLLLKRAHDPGSLEKLPRSMAKVQKSFDELNTTADDVAKKLAQLEVYTSKAHLVMKSSSDKVERIDSQYENQQIQISEQEVKAIRKLFNGTTESIEGSEQAIIASLQEIFVNSKESLRTEGEMIQMIGAMQSVHAPVDDVASSLPS